jgi:hypothetical protein
MVENKMGGSSRELPDRLSVDAQAAPPERAGPCLSETEVQVLLALPEDTDCCCGFAPLIEDTGLTRPEVRSACRSLAQKGLARFASGLWTEDYEPAGSGYGLTYEGAKYASAAQFMADSLAALADGASRSATGNGSTGERLTPNTAAEPVLPEAPKVKRRVSA